jgi:hypothetical protein
MAILAVSALPALADREVTQDERARLAAAVQAEGCSGGKFEMDEDDQQFEVDDAVCADGKKYDLKFDVQMRLKRKNLDWAVMRHRGRRYPAAVRASVARMQSFRHFAPARGGSRWKFEPPRFFVPRVAVSNPVGIANK